MSLGPLTPIWRFFGADEDLVADSRSDLRPDARTLINMAHLVAWRDAEAYHSRMQAMREARTDLRLLFSGPWPPYSFVA